MGGKSVKELMESGQVQKGTDELKVSDKVTEREMFKNSNLNKKDSVTETVSYIKTLEPMDAMKEANSVIGRKGKYKDLTPEESKKILQDTEDHIFERDVVPDEFDPEYAKGGRAGFYTGGITDVEPSLDDIGHGADALNSRTRLMSPGSQTTTSTGLNYLLAEDNDNMRIPFSTGKLAGGIDSAIEKNKNLEERITENKRMTDFLNKKYDERAIKNAPEGVLMDSPPKRKESLIEALKNAGEGTPQDGGAYSLNSDAYSNIIVFDDGTVYYKDTGEYYHKDLGQVTSPGEGAKIKPKEMEAAEGGRIGFSAGGGGRRAFLKLLATLGGATAAAKSGILTLGEGGAKKAITETVKQSAGSTYPPPYFYKLVEKIKFMGDDTLASKDKAIAKKYKDYTMEEDFAGNIEIIKKGDNVSEDVFMSLKVDEVPIKGKKGSTKVEEYEEYTARPDAEGKMKDIEQGVPDEVIDEVGDTTAMTLKKADGGRIGFSAGGGKFLLSKLGINSTTTRFLEKVFGKEKYKNLIANDPEMHRGLLEVAEMFRSKDKEGLKMYMQKFLPHMDDEMVEDFIVGSGGTEGIEGQLIRLGSGRDYAGKLEMMQKLNNVKKLENLEVTDEMIRKPNSDGGRIGFMSGGGIIKAIITKSAAKKGLKPYEYIKATNYKGLPPEVKMYISAEDYAQLKMGQEQMYSNFIDMAKTRLNFQKQVEGGKTTPARELFEGMEKTMDEQSFVPKTVTEKDIGEMELMIKNRFNKGRKDNAEGGLQTMLGE